MVYAMGVICHVSAQSSNKHDEADMQGINGILKHPMLFHSLCIILLQFWTWQIAWIKSLHKIVVQTPGIIYRARDELSK